MTSWTLIRFLHVVGIAFFVGGQLMLVVAVAPALRAGAGEETMRSIARRFGIGSAVALAVIIATGVAMASHYSVWDRSALQAKLMLLVLIAVLTGLHVVSTKTRAISLAIVVASLAIVWFGVKLSYG